MKRVITYGTFDLLHYGHINLLKRAKALGDYLIVAISTDEFNWEEKQKKCYFTYEQRKALVEAIRYVDLVIPETSWEQKKTDVHEYHIDTFVIGDDWQGKFDFLKDEGTEVVYLPRTPEISTTQIKNNLSKNEGKTICKARLEENSVVDETKENDSSMKAELVSMLEWFHEYCVQHGLRYYMLAGTMLGAVRHKGFIPWDDDIDVGMPRSDFNKLEELIGNKIIGKYYFETPKTEAEDYSYTYGKLYNTQTTLIEKRRVPVKRGIYLDIFPLDGAGNNEEEAKQYYKPINKKRNIYTARIAGIREGRSWEKNLAVKVMHCIPDFLFHEKKMLAEIDKMCSARDFDEWEYGGNLNGVWGIKEVMPRKYFGTPTLYNFENIQAFGVQDYDGYLTHQYGNWRELPPIEKRVTHHDNLIIDLKHSYMDTGNGSGGITQSKVYYIEEFCAIALNQGVAA